MGIWFCLNNGKSCNSFVGRINSSRDEKNNRSGERWMSRSGIGREENVPVELTNVRAETEVKVSCGFIIFEISHDLLL